MIKQSLDALTPRGPDVQQHEMIEHPETGMTVAIGFARLHIQGSAKNGAEQPFRFNDHANLVLCNGEIFNSEDLIERLRLKVPKGASDCAVIPALLERGDTLATVARQLDGDFAIAVVDLTNGSVTVTRDPYGVRPLYYASSLNQGWSAIVSELKGLPTQQEGEPLTILRIEPGTVHTFGFSGSIDSPIVWHQPPWLKTPSWQSAPADGEEALRIALEEAVAKRLTTVRELGACLSGGLDSSLIAAIAARALHKEGKRLHTYSVGMEGSPDILHARLVAKHIDSIHHERILTPEDCLSVIPDVIKAIETFDVTTVRASVGNYLVADLIHAETPAVKVVLNGDGADEILGGYLYMRAAPDDAAFETEIDRLLQEIHLYDVARSERTMAVHGLESRSPFLDRQFVAVARALPTEALRPTPSRLEKTVLRSAFANHCLLPDAVLWRRKEAFSDGISKAEKSWFELAKAEGEKQMDDTGEDWATKAATYTVNPPKTAEALWYRELFHTTFPQEAAVVVAPAMWMPRFIKDATDPSARTLTALYSTSTTQTQEHKQSHKSDQTQIKRRRRNTKKAKKRTDSLSLI